MQELFDDINAIRRAIEALQKRLQEQGKPVSRAELDEALAKMKATVEAQARPTINLDGAQVAKHIQGSLATPETLGAVLTAGATQLGTVVDRIPRVVAIEGDVVGFTSWKAVGIVAGVSVVLVLLLCGVLGLFSRATPAELGALKAEMARAQAQETLFRAGRTKLAQDYPALAHAYFPYPDDPRPKPAATAPKPAKSQKARR